MFGSNLCKDEGHRRNEEWVGVQVEAAPEVEARSLIQIGQYSRGSASCFGWQPHIFHYPTVPIEGRRDEEDGYFVIPGKRRSVILNILKAQGVSAIFAGHLHRNVYASDGELRLITTSAVGYPLGDDPSGLRIVKMYGDNIQHDYYGFDDVPESVEL